MMIMLHKITMDCSLAQTVFLTQVLPQHFLSIYYSSQNLVAPDLEHMFLCNQKWSRNTIHLFIKWLQCPPPPFFFFFLSFLLALAQMEILCSIQPNEHGTRYTIACILVHFVHDYRCSTKARLRSLYPTALCISKPTANSLSFYSIFTWLQFNITWALMNILDVFLN